MLLTVIALTASALTDDRFGLDLDLGAGGGAHFAQAAWTGRAGAAFWWGPYDPDYVFGRHTAVGVGAEVAVTQPEASGALTVELRRGVDLLAARAYGFVGTGPCLSVDGTVGAALRAGLGLHYRRTRHLGLGMRLDGGVDAVAGRWTPTVGALLDLALSAPTDGKTP